MWEIYAYQNSESLFGLLNAVVAICGSGSFAGSLAAVAFIGFCAAGIAYALVPQKLQGWQWLASVLLVYTVLLVPKVTVGIVDKTGGSPVRVVANVPFGIAAMEGLSSVIGNSITELFETAFQAIPGDANLPVELAYSKNGLVFGNRLIKQASGAVFTDPYFRTNMIEYLGNCVTYDISTGYINAAEFAASTNIWGFLKSHAPNPARFTPQTTDDGVSTIIPCDQAFKNLDQAMPAQLPPLMNQLAARANPTLKPADAVAAFAPQLQQAYLKNALADSAATAADILRQSAMINSMNDTSLISGMQINDQTKLLLSVGRSQAIQQTNSAWINNGVIAEQALPVIRNVLEALVIALFPLVILMLLMTSGQETMKAFKNYAAIVIWVQLWPPLYAVLNYMATLYAAKESAAAAMISTGASGMTLVTLDPVLSSTISSTAVVGYLTLSIPLLAWAALKRMENFGSTLAGSIGALQSTISSNTDAAKGNISVGNVSMDQASLAPSRTSPYWSSAQRDNSGDTITSGLLSNKVATSKLMSHGFGKMTQTSSVSDQQMEGARKSASSVLSQVTATGEERGRAITDAYLSSRMKHDGHHQGSATTTGGAYEKGQVSQNFEQVVDDVSQKTGLSHDRVAKALLGAGASIGYQFGQGGPKAGVAADAAINMAYSAGLSDEDRRVLSATSTEQFGNVARFVDKVSVDNTVGETHGFEGRAGSEHSDRIATSSRKHKDLAAELGRRLERYEQLQTERASSTLFSIETSADPENHEKFERLNTHYGPESVAAVIMHESELANHARSPHLAFATGAVAPRSEDDIVSNYRANTQRELGGENVDLPNNSGTRQDGQNRNKGDVQDHVATNAQAGPSPRQKTIDELRNKANEEMGPTSSKIHQQVTNSKSESDKQLQIVKDADGTISSNRSLMADNYRTIRSDTVRTYENAKEAATDVGGKVKKSVLDFLGGGSEKNKQ